MIANTKIIQALIQNIIEISRHIDQAADQAQAVKDNYQALGIDPTDTGLTQAQVTAVIVYFNAIIGLKDDPVALIAKSKDVPSHSSGVLK